MIRFRNLIPALNAVSADRPFITAWTDEDESEAVTFEEFRRCACVQAELLREHGLAADERVVIILPQGIPAMTPFVGAMMLGAIQVFLAYPNFKVEPSKYSSRVAGVTANLRAKSVVIDEIFSMTCSPVPHLLRNQNWFALWLTTAPAKRRPRCRLSR